MEAILENIHLEVVSNYTVGGKIFTVRSVFNSIPDYEEGKLSIMLIMSDSELLDDEIVALIRNTYKGEFPIMHVFKTDRLYISDITRHVAGIFLKLRKEEDANEN